MDQFLGDTGSGDPEDIGIRGTDIMDMDMDNDYNDEWLQCSPLFQPARKDGHLQPPHQRLLPDADCGLPPPLPLLCDQSCAGEGSATDIQRRRHCNIRNMSELLSSGWVLC